MVSHSPTQTSGRRAHLLFGADGGAKEQERLDLAEVPGGLVKDKTINAGFGAATALTATLHLASEQTYDVTSSSHQTQSWKET